MNGGRRPECRPKAVIDQSMCFNVFLSDGIKFCAYRYPPARVFPFGKIAYERISEINPGGRYVVAEEREILFAGSSDSLTRLAAEQGIPIVRRHDVWGLIAEPFLDRAFDDAQTERTLQMLKQNNISRREVSVFRASLKTEMLAYAAYFQESEMFGMEEVLTVQWSKLLRNFWSRRARNRFDEFYWQFMETALRAETFRLRGD